MLKTFETFAHGFLQARDRHIHFEKQYNSIQQQHYRNNSNDSSLLSVCDVSSAFLILSHLIYRRCNGRESTYQSRRCERCSFQPWVGKTPQRRKWQPTPAFLPRESHGQRSLVGCCPQRRTESDTTEATQHACVHWRKKWQPTPVFLPGESRDREA